MKGTAILFQPNQKVTIIEDIDLKTYESIKNQCGCTNCTCKVESTVVDFGTVSPALWHEDEVDWAYGY
jgi:hypothetical protein